MSETKNQPTAGPAPGFAKHPDYSVDLLPAQCSLTIWLDGEAVCRTAAALEVRESNHAPVWYVPLGDLDPTVLLSSDTQTYCPFKGQASYHGIRTAKQDHADVLWEYEAPFDEVSGLRGYAGVYENRVDQIELKAITT